eukprot:291521_1
MVSLCLSCVCDSSGDRYHNVSVKLPVMYVPTVEFVFNLADICWKSWMLGRTKYQLDHVVKLLMDTRRNNPWLHSIDRPCKLVDNWRSDYSNNSKAGYGETNVDLIQTSGSCCGRRRGCVEHGR